MNLRFLIDGTDARLQYQADVMCKWYDVPMVYIKDLPPWERGLPEPHTRMEDQAVRSGCAVRDVMYGATPEFIKVVEVPTEAIDSLNMSLVAKRAQNTADDVRKKFNAAIDYAISLDSSACVIFLIDWREGDLSDWPDYSGPKP